MGLHCSTDGTGLEIARKTPSYHMFITSSRLAPHVGKSVSYYITAFSRFYLKHRPDIALENSGEAVLSMVVVVPGDYASLRGCNEKCSDNE
jgi:hypothetical protein